MMVLGPDTDWAIVQRGKDGHITVETSCSEAGTVRLLRDTLRSLVAQHEADWPYVDPAMLNPVVKGGGD